MAKKTAAAWIADAAQYETEMLAARRKRNAAMARAHELGASLRSIRAGVGMRSVEGVRKAIQLHLSRKMS